MSRLVHVDDGLDPDAGLGGDPGVDEDGMLLDDEEDDAEATDQSWETEDGDEEDEDEEDEGAVSVVECTRDQVGVAPLVNGAVNSHDHDDDDDDDPDDPDFEMEDAAALLADDGREGDRRKSKRRRAHGPLVAEETVKGWADEEEEQQQQAPAAAAATASEGTPVAATTVDKDQPSEPVVATTFSSAADSAKPPAASTSTGAATAVSMPTETDDFEDWSRFQVLEEAPEDHHYYNERVLAPSKAFMSRVRKEHQVLASSLPRERIFLLGPFLCTEMLKLIGGFFFRGI